MIQAKEERRGWFHGSPRRTRPFASVSSLRARPATESRPAATGEPSSLGILNVLRDHLDDVTQFENTEDEALLLLPTT